MQLIDLSQTIAPNMPLFSPRAPQPVIQPWMSHAQAAESGNYQDCTCEITEVQFVTSCSTYLDSPYHFNPNGATIDQLDLAQVVLPGMVVTVPNPQPNTPIPPETLAGLDIAGKAVLFHTGWSQYWGQDQYYQYPFIPGDTAQALVAGGAKLAGMDFLAADNITDPTRPAHTTLLRNNVLIMENMTNLVALPKADFTLHAAPVKVAGAAAFPVRAYAVVMAD